MAAKAEIAVVEVGGAVRGAAAAASATASVEAMAELEMLVFGTMAVKVVGRALPPGLVQCRQARMHTAT